MQQRGVRMPRTAILRRGRALRRARAEIRYLTLEQIDEQLAALADWPQLQAMVATFIYAGLRREEALG